MNMKREQIIAIMASILVGHIIGDKDITNEYVKGKIIGDAVDIASDILECATYFYEEPKAKQS